MYCSKKATLQSEIYASIVALLFYPLAFVCLWIIVVRSSQVECRALVNVIVGLLMVGDVVYPTSRFLFYGGCNGGNEVLFSISSAFGGIS